MSFCWTLFSLRIFCPLCPLTLQSCSELHFRHFPTLSLGPRSFVRSPAPVSAFQFLRRHNRGSTGSIMASRALRCPISRPQRAARSRLVSLTVRIQLWLNQLLHSRRISHTNYTLKTTNHPNESTTSFTTRFTHTSRGRLSGHDRRSRRFLPGRPTGLGRPLGSRARSHLDPRRRAHSRVQRGAVCSRVGECIVSSTRSFDNATM